MWPRVFRDTKHWFMNTIVYDKIYKWHIKSEIKKRNPFLPLVVYPECTNACNGKCITCPREKMTRKVGFMDMKLYQKIIDECVELGIPDIHLHNYGEALLDKNFIKKAQYSKSKGIKRTIVYTNGSLLDKNIARRIVEEELLDLIFFSIDAATNETYKKMRPSLDLKEIEKNIMTMINLKKDLNKSKPFITVKMTCTQINIHEKIEFQTKWKGLVDHVAINNAHDWAGEKENIQINYLSSSTKRYACPILWNSFYILWDGQVTICCEDFDGKIFIGDISKNTILSLWNSEKMNEFRKLHLEDQIDKIPLCNKCSIIVNNSLWWRKGDCRLK